MQEESIDCEKPQSQGTGPKEAEKEKMKGLRRVRRGLLSPAEAVRVRAGELERGVMSLLFPGRLKRKHISFKTNAGIREISRANGNRVKVQEKMREMKRKEMEKEKRMKEMGKEKLKQKVTEEMKVQAERFSNEFVSASELFVFG